MFKNYKAEYLALKAQVTDERMVENAEKIVKAAINVSAVTMISFSEALDGLLDAIWRQKTTGGSR